MKRAIQMVCVAGVVAGLGSAASAKVKKRIFVLVLFVLLCPTISLGDWTLAFLDNFDDGDYSGWNVTSPAGDPADAPAVLPSPGGYAIWGVGSGYSGYGLGVYLTQPISISNVGELKIEKGAISGYQTPNCAQVHLLSGDDHYMFVDYGEGARYARFTSVVGGVENTFTHPVDTAVWHEFEWIRDVDGWWSMNMDGAPEWTKFYHDLTPLTYFDQVAIHVLRNQSAIEWVGVSIPEPATLSLLALGGLAVLRRRSRQAKTLASSAETRGVQVTSTRKG